MAGINLESLVRGTRVVKSAVVMAQVGSKPATQGNTDRLSHERRLSLRYRLDDAQCFQPQEPTDTVDADMVASRAGRSEGAVGVLVRRSPAIFAGTAVRLLRSAVRGQCLGSNRRFGLTQANRPAVAGKVLDGGFRCTSVWPMPSV